jgi:hypothetical protein
MRCFTEIERLRVAGLRRARDADEWLATVGTD